MALVISLVVEASTYAGSTALLDGSTLLGDRSVAMRGREHEALMPAVAELLAEAGISPREIHRVICGAGPGSFTSLRIAASIAKGIALAADAALVPVSSLALLVASREPRQAGRFVAAVDAMRGEHYVQTYEQNEAGDLEFATGLTLVPSGMLREVAKSQRAMLLGPQVHVEEGSVVVPHARSAAYITKLIDSIPSVDLASWEPAYGRLAEAQVKWEAAHGRPLHAG
jgi:tRNA threonylcarbamoyladenosine biosynthesis protein TsaB